MDPGCRIRHAISASLSVFPAPRCPPIGQLNIPSSVWGLSFESLERSATGGFSSSEFKKTRNVRALALHYLGAPTTTEGRLMTKNGEGTILGHVRTLFSRNDRRIDGWRIAGTVWRGKVRRRRRPSRF